MHRYLSRVRNLDRLSPKTQLLKFSRSTTASLLRESQNLPRVGRLAFCPLRDKLRWEKKSRLIFIHSFFFFYINIFLEKYIFGLSREIYCRAMKIQRNLRRKPRSQERGFLCCYIAFTSLNCRTFTRSF